MTTRFSEKTSFEIVGLIPTPYSILASYLVSVDILNPVGYGPLITPPSKS